MTYDVARVRGLIPSLGDGAGCTSIRRPEGMLVPDAVSRAVSTGFRTSAFSHTARHGGAAQAQRRHPRRRASGGRGPGRRRSRGRGARLPDRALLLAWLAGVAEFPAGAGHRHRAVAAG